MPGICRWAYGFLQRVPPVLDRHQHADVVGGAGAPHVGADVRREVAARADDQRRAERRVRRQRPRRVGLRLLLPRDRQHALVHAALDQARRDDRRRPADRAGRVHAHDRLARRAERVRQERLRHHHALEQVGRLADDDRVDVLPGQPGVVERPPGRLAHQPRHRHVEPLGLVRRLPDADDRAGVSHHLVPPARRRGSAGGTARTSVGERPRRRPVVDAGGGLADADQARRHHRVGRQRAAGRVDRHVVAQPERLAQDQLLVGELRVQLGDLDAGRARLLPGDAPPTPSGSGPARPASAPRCGGRCR